MTMPAMYGALLRMIWKIVKRTSEGESCGAQIFPLQCSETELFPNGNRL